MQILLLKILFFYLLFSFSLSPKEDENQNNNPNKVINMTILNVQEKYSDSLMSISGVEGIGIGKKGEKDCIVIFTGNILKENKKKLPKELDGYPVIINKSGKIIALPKK